MEKAGLKEFGDSKVNDIYSFLDSSKESARCRCYSCMSLYMALSICQFFLEVGKINIFTKCNLLSFNFYLLLPFVKAALSAKRLFLTSAYISLCIVRHVNIILCGIYHVALSGLDLLFI